jgi:tRNA dimethylallyltransferase
VRTKHLIVIAGATATGKTAVATAVARHCGAPILSADSRQFYREMTIGTAKPFADVLADVPHHFVNALSIQEPYSAGCYERDALKVLEKVYQVGDVALLVGGSGLFIRAVCEGLDRFPDIPETTKAWVQQGEAVGGLTWLQQALAEADPVYFQKVDRNNPARLRRALAVCHATGCPYSAFLTDARPARPFVSHYMLLERPRQALYDLIDARVDAMVAAGLEAEARGLYPFRDLPALHTVGYEEWFDYFEGRVTRDDTIAKIKQHTRNYAKRQDTWFRKHGSWTRFDPEQLPEIMTWVERLCNAPTRLTG